MPTSVSSGLPEADMQTYTDDAHTFQFEYPSAFAQSPGTLDSDDITGLTLTYPASYSQGTKLNEATIHIGAMSRACAAPEVSNQQTVSQQTINGIAFTKVTGSDAGAGNLYETTNYTTTHDGNCYHLTLLLHSCNLGPDCGEGRTADFDRSAIEKTFDQIVSSFTFIK